MCAILKVRGVIPRRVVSVQRSIVAVVVGDGPRTRSNLPLQPAAVADGLVASANFTQAIADGWYVALVIWPNVDFHWYRQDKIGCWSHKPGSTAVTNKDNSGNPITDPKTANRGGYTQFCSYMITRPCKVRIK